MLDDNRNEKEAEKLDDIKENDVNAAADEEETAEEKSIAMELYDWIQCFIAPLVVGILIFLFVFRVITVVGSSMNPTLLNGDKVIVSDLFFTPKYGDIIVCKAENFGDEYLIKRVIATEGQTVDIDFEEGVVYVDGKPLDEPYTAAKTHDREDFRGEVTVPEGCVFVMGDNRNASTDSRTTEIGMIDKRAILGKVYIIFFPGRDYNNNRDFKRIGSVY